MKQQPSFVKFFSLFNYLLLTHSSNFLWKTFSTYLITSILYFFLIKKVNNLQCEGAWKYKFYGNFVVGYFEKTFFLKIVSQNLRKKASIIFI